jgi:hypothetical protein
MLPQRGYFSCGGSGVGFIFLPKSLVFSQGKLGRRKNIRPEKTFSPTAP